MSKKGQKRPDYKGGKGSKSPRKTTVLGRVKLENRDLRVANDKLQQQVTELKAAKEHDGDVATELLKKMHALVERMTTIVFDAGITDKAIVKRMREELEDGWTGKPSKVQGPELCNKSEFDTDTGRPVEPDQTAVNPDSAGAKAEEEEEQIV